MPTMESSGARPDTRRSPVRDAFLDLWAVSPGFLAFGVFMGLEMTRMGLGPEAVVGALLVYGGSAQFTSLSLLHLGAGMATALLSGIAVNARLLLYGAVLAPRFGGQPRWFRVLAPGLIQDQTFLSATGRPQYAGAEFRRYWWWLGLSGLAVWTGSLVAAVLAGPMLPELPHLVLMGTALFVAMLVPRLVDRRTVAIAATAGATALVLHEIAPSTAILGGTLAGLVLAVTNTSKEAAR